MFVPALNESTEKQIDRDKDGNKLYVRHLINFVTTDPTDLSFSHIFPKVSILETKLKYYIPKEIKIAF